MLRVMTIVGTRPEIIRLSEVIKACDRYFNHQLVHTGQNWDYTLNEVFFKELQIREPDHYLDSVGDNLGQTIGNIISKSYELLEKTRPDAILILGDTNSALCALSAKRLKIPVFHMEAGNRCFDQNVPEEINRKIVDHISDINLSYTEHSRRHLLAEGIRREHVMVTGSPMTEVLKKHRGSIVASNVLQDLGLTRGQYFLVSAHREENIDNEQNFYALMSALNEIAEKYRMPVIYSTHPRSWKRIEESGWVFHELVRKMRPFGFFDYNRLQMDAFCTLSDSGTLSEESAILGFPGVLIRTSTERPEVLDKGTIIIGGNRSKDIIEAIELSAALNGGSHAAMDIPDDYQDETVSIKVVKIIQSYVPIVNRVVWGKPVS